MRKMCPLKKMKNLFHAIKIALKTLGLFYWSIYEDNFQ